VRPADFPRAAQRDAALCIEFRQKLAIDILLHITLTRRTGGIAQTFGGSQFDPVANCPALRT
jgi:hypothetical protein